jgi:hypothetical protein
MKHTLIELDYTFITPSLDAEAALELLSSYPDSTIVAVTSFARVEERLVAAANAGHGTPGGASSARAEALISALREEHRFFARALGASAFAVDAALLRIDRLLGRLWTLLACPAVGVDRRARILAVGEELSATCTALALVSLGRPAPILEPGALRTLHAARGTDPRARGTDPGSWPFGAVLPGLELAGALAADLDARLVSAGRLCLGGGELAAFARAVRPSRAIARSPGVA